MTGKKRWPTAKQVELLVCEDVRLEQNNKFTLTGFYPGAKILVIGPTDAKERPPVILEVVSLVVIINGGRGTFNAKMDVISPNDSQLAQMTFDAAEVKEGSTSTIVAKLRPFAVKTFGIHRVNLTLDDKTYKLKFVVEANPGAVALASAAA